MSTENKKILSKTENGKKKIEMRNLKISEITKLSSLRPKFTNFHRLIHRENLEVSIFDYI